MEFKFVEQRYFEERMHFTKMLDSKKTNKQKKRMYLFFKMKYKDKHVLVPLRKNIDPERKFGIIGYRVPSSTRPNAGLDFRYMLILQDEEYLDDKRNVELSNSQQRIIRDNYQEIETAVIKYIDGFKKAAKKNRIQREALYRESSLINFREEIGVD